MFKNKTIKFRGNYNNKHSLDKGILPENSVPFREPKSAFTLNLIAGLVCLPIYLGVIALVYFKTGKSLSFYEAGDYRGIILAFIMIFPHELLHAMAFPTGSKIDIWFNIKHLQAFVHSTSPTSKSRFIWLSLLPNLIFSYIPLAIWFLMLDPNLTSSKIVFSFGAISALFSCGDLLNVFNALTQMPNGTITQLSGFNSYWYYPEKVN